MCPLHVKEVLTDKISVVAGHYSQSAMLFVCSCRKKKDAYKDGVYEAHSEFYSIMQLYKMYVSMQFFI